MDTITKGGVIWEYLKGEVAAGREDITKADLMKVGYSAQAIENAIREIKKEKIAAKAPSALPGNAGVFGTQAASVATSPKLPLPPPSATPTPSLGGENKIPQSSLAAGIAPSQTTVPSVGVSLKSPENEQALLNDLSKALQEDTKISFSAPIPAQPRGVIPSAMPPTPAAPVVSQSLASPSASITSQSSRPHQNLGGSLSSISVMPPDLANASLKNIDASAASKTPVTPPSIPPVSTPLSVQPPAPTMPVSTPSVVVPRPRRGILAKLGWAVIIIMIALGVGGGVSYGMTGQIIPPQVASRIPLVQIPFISDLLAIYSPDTLFPAMLSKLGELHTARYTLAADVYTKDSDVSGGMRAKAEVTGAIDVTKESSLDNDFSTRVSAEFTADGMSFKGAGEVRKVGDALYVHLEEFPDLGFFNLDTIKGVWIRADKTSAQAFGYDDLLTAFSELQAFRAQALTPAGGAESPSEAEIEAQIAHLKNSFFASNVLTATFEEKEVLNSVSTYRYLVTIDRQAVYNFIAQASSELSATYGEKALVRMTPEELASIKEQLLSAETEQSLKSTNFKVWIDSRTAWPVQFEITSTAITPQSSVSVDSTIRLTLADINEPIKVEVPGDVISAEEAYTRLTGKTMEMFRADKQYDQVSDIFYALADYKALTGTYPVQLTELMKTRKQLKTEFPGRASSVKSSFDFATWADDLPLLSRIPKDVYSKTDYSYQKSGTDYKLTYPIMLTATSSVPTEYVNGVNTMTSKAISVEGLAALKGKKR